ncbi:Cys-tRNA(Pro) deacylase, prolyl-tRNA editing enzyme YbaK/EbsC [Streptomyces yunnanensis]|uniref:Cys-tRNA(Pro) deacylase, prolyl-tRNA editing enzyme YbaK/EbsC n=2 Tax=Streptomyces TaxID=1883 RepID=A0A9X8MM13_9ACTN|nr:Cys-tRNA(Pro) deacylase, prolyl-tRNA editing enzyme YbaK/EbsC [Streptomyces yunnanensis]
MARTAFASVRAMSDSGTETAPAAQPHPRFAEALTALGLNVEVRRFPEATPTAAQAAAAIGCDLDQIVKSLIFTAWGSADAPSHGDGVPVLVLMDGASRVDVERVRAELGATKVRRADAALVRETTGYAIGGVPPFGHRTRTTVLADRGILAHHTVWAAAGTPHTVFPLDPQTLIAHAGGRVVDVREQTS